MQGLPLTLRPAFAPRTTAYAVAVPYAVAGVALTPAAGDEGASVTVNGVEVARGEASAAIPLAVGETVTSRWWSPPRAGRAAPTG